MIWKAIGKRQTKDEFWSGILEVPLPCVSRQVGNPGEESMSECEGNLQTQPVGYNNTKDVERELYCDEHASGGVRGGLSGPDLG